MLHCTTTFYPRGGGSWSGRAGMSFPGTADDLYTAAKTAQKGGKR